MLKRKALKKIFISLSCLLILGIIYLFPNKNEPLNTTITKKETSIIYIMDSNNYIARVNTVLNSKTDLEKIKEIINILTIGSNKYIREGFKKIIPENTKLLNVSIDNNLAKLNFSKELLNISVENEEKMIESIIYSLTSIETIEYISIFVEGEILNELPNSKKKLNTILDRTYGINKEINITSLNNTQKTTIYYVSKQNDYYYYVPITKYLNSDISKIEIIIKELTSRTLLNTNLITYLNSNTELLSYNETVKF